MAKKAVRDAVAARLAAQWPTTTILDLNEDVLTPSDAASWVRLDFPAANNEKMTYGSRFREDGAFRIVVATPIRGGTTTSATYCESIATIFRNQKFDGVQCWAPTIREGVDEGVYFIASVVVPYHYTYAD